METRTLVTSKNCKNKRYILCKYDIIQAHFKIKSNKIVIDIYSYTCPWVCFSILLKIVSLPRPFRAAFVFSIRLLIITKLCIEFSKSL